MHLPVGMQNLNLSAGGSLMAYAITGTYEDQASDRIKRAVREGRTCLMKYGFEASRTRLLTPRFLLFPLFAFPSGR